MMLSNIVINIVYQNQVFNIRPADKVADYNKNHQLDFKQNNFRDLFSGIVSIRCIY